MGNGTSENNVIYFNGTKYQIVSEEEYTKLQKINSNIMVRCDDGNRVYYIPRTEFARVLMQITETPNKKYVRYATGAAMYDMSERSFIELAKSAEAVHKIRRMVLVEVAAVDRYISYFKGL